MSALPSELPALRSRHTADIAASCALDADALAIVPDAPEARAFVHRLLSERRWTDAVHFLGHGLAIADGVRWARACAEHVEAGQATERTHRALELAGAWLATTDPDARRELREEAATLAQASGYRQPSDWGLVAIANSEAPAGADRPELYALVAGRAVAAAIILAATRGNETIVQDHDDLYAELLRTFLAYGIDLAAGASGALDPDRLAEYTKDDPLDGRTKVRVLHLGELADGGADV
jgi:hypothetical protein